MRLYYDFHLHSCLSPCGDDDMTPYNLVNLAKLFGYDIIALTDHNSCQNCPAAVEIGKSIGITVVPGMELCTSEEIHCICLLPDLKAADDFSEYVISTMVPILNKPKIFGNQFIMDTADKIIGQQDRLLISASSISIVDLPEIIAEYGGVCYPAHIDRDSYSIISSLGDFPADLKVNCFELTPEADEKHFLERYESTQNKLIIRSSDAHCLEHMREREFYIDLPENTPQSLISYLKGEIK